MKYIFIILIIIFSTSADAQSWRERWQERRAERMAERRKNDASNQERAMMHDGRERTYTIDKPRTASSGARLPVIIMLHGGGGNGENGKRMSGFTDIAVPRGVIAVYPSGTNRSERIKKLTT